MILNCLSYYIEKQLIEFYVSTVYLVMMLKLFLKFSYFGVAVDFIDYSKYILSKINK